MSAHWVSAKTGLPIFGFAGITLSTSLQPQPKGSKRRKTCQEGVTSVYESEWCCPPGHRCNMSQTTLLFIPLHEGQEVTFGKLPTVRALSRIVGNGSMIKRFAPILGGHEHADASTEKPNVSAASMNSYRLAVDVLTAIYWQDQRFHVSSKKYLPKTRFRRFENTFRQPFSIFDTIQLVKNRTGMVRVYYTRGNLLSTFPRVMTKRQKVNKPSHLLGNNFLKLKFNAILFEPVDGSTKLYFMKFYLFHWGC